MCSSGSKLAEWSPPTLMVRSSHPRDTRTLMGGSVRLVSWVSTVALIAFCWRTYTVWSHVTWKNKKRVHFVMPHLEQLKQHVVEVGRHVDDVERLVGTFGCKQTLSVDPMCTFSRACVSCKKGRGFLCCHFKHQARNTCIYYDGITGPLCPDCTV